VPSLRRSKWYDPIRRDRRFEELMAKYRIPGP